MAGNIGAVKIKLSLFSQGGLVIIFLCRLIRIRGRGIRADIAGVLTAHLVSYFVMGVIGVKPYPDTGDTEGKKHHRDKSERELQNPLRFFRLHHPVPAF